MMRAKGTTLAEIMAVTGWTNSRVSPAHMLSVLVARFEFVEWTSDRHLRHSPFVALRGDKKSSEVRREWKK